MSPTTPMLPTAWPEWSKMAPATLDSPSTASSRSRAMPLSRAALSSFRSADGVRVRLVSFAGASASRSSTSSSGL